MNRELNLRRGKAGFSQEEYAKKVRKEASWSKYFDTLTALLFLITWVGGMVDDFNDASDMIIFDIIWNVVWGFLYYKLYSGFKKISDEALKEQLYVINECEKRGVNVVEYAELLKKEEVGEFEQEGK